MKGEEKMMIRVQPSGSIYEILDQEIIDYQSINPFDIIEEGFTGDWRQGQEIQQVIITKRFYQVSSNSIEA